MAVIIDITTVSIGLIATGATVVLAIITRRYVHLTKDYVRLTREILEENRQTRLATQKPIIAIYLRSKIREYTSVRLCVENIGAGPAYDIKFVADPSFTFTNGRSVGNVRFLMRGIRYLPPRQKREEFLGSSSNSGFGELMSKQLNINITYKDSVNKEYDENFCLDFREH